MRYAIDRLLVVDDRRENIAAAKEFFSTLENVLIEYASSARQAIEMIREAYNTRPYRMVLTDLQMEENTSGALVAWTGFQHQAYSIIVTGRGSPNNHHGPSTLILPHMTSVSGMKDDPKVWEKIWQTVYDDMQNKPMIFDALQRVREYVGMPLTSNADTAMMMFPSELREYVNARLK